MKVNHSSCSEIYLWIPFLISVRTFPNNLKVAVFISNVKHDIMLHYWSERYFVILCSAVE